MKIKGNCHEVSYSFSPLSGGDIREVKAFPKRTKNLKSMDVLSDRKRLPRPQPTIAYQRLCDQDSLTNEKAWNLYKTIVFVIELELGHVTTRLAINIRAGWVMT